LETKECLHVLKGHESQVYSVAFDGRRIVTGSLDKTARVWDLQSGYASNPSKLSGELMVHSACLAVLRGFTSLVSQLQFLPDTLLTGDSGGALRIWSMKDYAELRRMDAHENSVTSMQNDGTRIVSGGSDGWVKEWDYENGELLRDVVTSEAVWRVGYAGGRIAAVFSREGNVVLGVSHDLISD
jgi:F-box and WD-40 domain protein CDC4